MSRDMPWRPNLSRSSSKLSAVKGYISQRNVPSALQRGVAADGAKQSWKEWAGQKISAARGNGASQSSERIALFPGWAARRYHQDAEGRTQEAFDIDLFVSGFASSHRAPELAGRSQRAFMRLAKGFAALPKLDGSENEPALTRSTEDLLAAVKLPPRPTEITEEFEVEALERQFQRVNNRSDTESSFGSESSFEDDELETPVITTSSSSSSSSLPGDIRRLHRNLEARIQPFWSSVLPSRTVRIKLFCSPLKDGKDDSHLRHNTVEEQDALEHGPVAARELTTGIDGSFQARIRISWEELCHHPGALHVAFGDPMIEHELLVTAALFPAASPARLAPTLPAHHAVETKTLRITLTHSPVRVVSDIDDTVKAANIVNGARAIFHNVFVKEYKDIVIPGMGEWYTRMWRRGVRFHYVSNGPFELLPILADFFQVSRLPPGSIKLRSYAGRSLFSGLLSAPAARKRAGVQEILQAFPESRFLLIGDSGEQDLELYAELARERPQQILAVFIRDVETGERLEDPTGWNAVHDHTTTTAATMLDNQDWPRESWPPSTPTLTATPPAYNIPSPGPYKEYFPTPSMTTEPEPIPGMSMSTTARPTNGQMRVPSINTNAQAPSSSSASIRSLRTPTSAASIRSVASNNTSVSASSMASAQTQQRVLLEADRRRAELQLRVWRARAVIPAHVPLRIFRDPAECVEAEAVLVREKF
ncbi:hypothetical protein C8F04DRAFT_989210 [Mycena alexandri]|uniref:Phosphatidate phosphatase APP1 catalytic domain-containing protein n=1 Tax=Mycena alexandri TaxID=1745969 RepID=A0AAD6TGN0_9AGAR|nr:hypothetical protein C8F04DRAFT_989210 [Mycena alexandri]